MNTVAERRPFVAGAAVVVAVVLLTVRTEVLAELPPVVGLKVGLLTLVYAAIAASSLLIETQNERAQLPPSCVLPVGVLAVGLAALAAGPAGPLPAAALVMPLSIAAAVSEELLFRGLAYAELRRWGVSVAVGGSAVLFALIHLPAHGPVAFPVDLGAGLLLSWQRWASGSWRVPAATHVAANVLAVIR